MTLADDPMWCIVMFDLPTQTSEQRRDYTHFRNLLLDNGFIRIQYSVYTRFSPSGVLSARVVEGIKRQLPDGGEVRLLHVTDRQWASTLRFFNATEKSQELQPEQLAFF